MLITYVLYKEGSLVLSMGRYISTLRLKEYRKTSKSFGFPKLRKLKSCRSYLVFKANFSSDNDEFSTFKDGIGGSHTNNILQNRFKFRDLFFYQLWILFLIVCMSLFPSPSISSV